MEEEFGTNSPAFKAVNIQYIQFLKKNALTFLAQEGFLPTAGLPTGIVEFDTTNIDNLKNKNTTAHFHNWGTSAKDFNSYPKLKQNLKVTSNAVGFDKNKVRGSKDPW